MLWIFIAVKNPLLLVRFEPAKVGSNGKHDNHYTTKNDMLINKLQHSTVRRILTLHTMATS
jgi:hypothetical protein